MIRSHTMRGPVAAALLACVIASGCASSPRPELTVHDSPRGSVYLERIPETSFQATHPINLEPGTIARALRGIHVRDDRKTLQALLAPRPEPSRAFSDEEADFFAPLIASAFSKAASGQWIGFRIVQTGPPSYSKKEGAGLGSSEPPLTLAPKEITSGVLFAYGRSLQIHLTQFRSGSQKRSMIDGPNRHYSDQTGLTGRELVFFPKEAQRPDTFRVGATESPTVVIDYELLARLPLQQQQQQPPAAPGEAAGTSATAQPVVVPHTTSELEAVKESVSKKDAEVEALKKEMEAIKKQLNEQQKPAQPKRKSKPAAKSAQ